MSGTPAKSAKKAAATPEATDVAPAKGPIFALVANGLEVKFEISNFADLTVAQDMLNMAAERHGIS